MSSDNLQLDAVVIGGGFYGAAIAIYLAKQRGLKNITLLERESALLTRASYHNQARVHNGYHYPRSFTTAYRSRINLPRFVRDWPSAIQQDFTKLYAIARRNSKVTAKQFERFCYEIGAHIQPATKALTALFEPRLIEAVFKVEEYAFNTTQLASWAKTELAACNIKLALATTVTEINNHPQQGLLVTIENNGTQAQLHTQRVFNCTYSGLNNIRGDFRGVATGLKHELTEMALIALPDALANLGITVMDGPFFSVMPFPARGLHTLSHVRYTPHLHWADAPDINPYQKLQEYQGKTRVDRMLRDTARYIPAMTQAQYLDSLFEVKTILAKSEGDDGRPILFEKHHNLPGCFSILGGKIDNIYDVLEKLDAEKLL